MKGCVCACVCVCPHNPLVSNIRVAVPTLRLLFHWGREMAWKICLWRKILLLINFLTILLFSVWLYTSTSDTSGASGPGPFWALLSDWIDFDECTHWRLKFIIYWLSRFVFSHLTTLVQFCWHLSCWFLFSWSLCPCGFMALLFLHCHFRGWEWIWVFKLAHRTLFRIHPLNFIHLTFLGK